MEYQIIFAGNHLWVPYNVNAEMAYEKAKEVGGILGYRVLLYNAHRGIIERDSWSEEDKELAEAEAKELATEG